MPGTLYLVGTPIGNLEDMAPRALRVLREVAVIAAEDTRHTLNLLNHFGIKARMLSYHQHNEQERSAELLALLKKGDSVALVTDAGLPGISDPGETLVRAVTEAGLPVVPVPGPSACLLALAASGLPAGGFRFVGFLPRAGKERRAVLAELAMERATIILYEAPHRLCRTLGDLREAFGGDRVLAVARELTKVHEEFWRGNLEGALARYAEGPVKGEFTLVVAGVEKPAEEAVSLADGLARIEEMVRGGIQTKEAIRQVAQTTGLARNSLYRSWLAQKTCPRENRP